MRRCHGWGKQRFDYIERNFENEAGELVFNMKEQTGHDLGSRHGGEEYVAR